MRREERPLTGEYWAAIDRRELTRPVCHRCGRSHFAPQLLCPFCQSNDWSYQPSSGLGTVYSHTTIHRAPDSRFVTPYVVADIEMDEGWRLFSWITGCELSNVTIGMAVEVTYEAGVDGELLPVFEPSPRPS